MYQRDFASNYTALDSTAAAHITSSSSIRLVGIDYLSIGMLEDIGETHRTLFRGVSLHPGAILGLLIQGCCVRCSLSEHRHAGGYR
jgi:hypothetical protein